MANIDVVVPAGSDSTVTLSLSSQSATGVVSAFQLPAGTTGVVLNVHANPGDTTQLATYTASYVSDATALTVTVPVSATTLPAAGIYRYNLAATTSGNPTIMAWGTFTIEAT